MIEFKPFKNPLVVALDVDTDAIAYKLADEISEFVGGFKLGPRLIHRYGREITMHLSKLAPVFVDCKFFDIPSTMEAAVRASFDSGASVVTVHALSGKEALQSMAKLEKELNSQRAFRILAVTVLTSWDENSVPPVMTSVPLPTMVHDLAKFTQDCGLSSIVCSAHELDHLKDLDLFKLTPGIRFSLESHGDQKRVMDPESAMKLGASAIVVGRPIVEAKNPREAALDYSVAIYKKPKISLS